MKDKSLYFFKLSAIWCIGILFLASCAQVVAPGGGPIDKTAPKVLKYEPDSATVNFKARSIEILFDEFIVLQGLNDQLIISPPMDKAPDIKVKEKKLLIEFDKAETLKPNTTYCFNFGNSLQDFNENNPKENFKYIFSTGSFIDSLIVTGKVENAFDHTTEKGILVMLYSDFSDSVVYKKQPDYFGKTQEDGSFQINNIKDGKYKILALKDANANYKYDGESEKIGFSDSIINVSAKPNILIELFQESQNKFFIKKHVHSSFGEIDFVFNKSADSLTINPINHTFKENDVIFDYSTNKDSLTYWIKNFDKDSLTLETKYGSKILDTVEFKMTRKETAIKNNRSPLELSLLSSPNGSQEFDLNAEIKFVFNHPIDSIKKDAKFELKQDTLLFKKHADLFLEKAQAPDIKTVFLKQNKANTSVNPILKESTNYHLFIPPGTFTDIFGLTNDSILVNFNTREEKYYGTVKLKVNIPSDSSGKTVNYIIQLLDEKENKVRENFIHATETIDYTYLRPQKYKLKIVVDENTNGKWDGGKLLKKIQPEKVIYYSELINIRSNWDSDLEWRLSE